MGVTYAITQLNTFEAESALDIFINGDLQGALEHIRNLNASVYLSCRLDSSAYNGRRLLVVADANQDLVRVCVEAAYELFEGDTHYHVERIGTSSRSGARDELPRLLHQAYDRLISWKPTHENIWDNVY
jgi:hypothetical protein